jgi:hypothetical protein
VSATMHHELAMAWLCEAHSLLDVLRLADPLEEHLELHASEVSDDIADSYKFLSKQNLEHLMINY